MHCLYCGEKITTTTVPGHGTRYIHEAGYYQCALPVRTATPRIDFS